MEFNTNQSIYLQVYDYVCDKILAGEFSSQERIPSVREYGIELSVNPNTIMRAYEKLSADDIIFNKRGIGYFVSDGASEKIIALQREQFITQELPKIASRMRLLRISSSELISYLDR